MHGTGQMNVCLHLVHLGSDSALTREQPPKVTPRGLWGHLFHILLGSQGSVLFQRSERWVQPMTFEVAATHGDEERRR